MALRKPVAVAGALLGGALAAWVVTFVRMRGMDAGPGAELGGLGWYLGIWVTMTAAMMLPATAPMVVVFSRVSREREVRVSAPYAGPETVTCVIPGHERSGRELVVEELHVDAGLLAFEYRGVCAYESTFDYSG